jgi:hypothetical protein
MSYRVHRTRLAFVLGGTLLLSALLPAPGQAAAAPRGQSAPRRAVAAPASLLGRLQELLGYLWEGRGSSGPVARPAASSTSGTVHPNAGCGIDPNGTGCTGGGVP